MRIGYPLSSREGARLFIRWVGLLILHHACSTLLQLAKLDYLAGYFDTDAQSMAGLSHEAAVDRFSSMVP